MRNYDDHRDEAGRRQQAQSSAGRDIGELPRIENIDRRASCRDSLRLFCETYSTAAFRLEWSADHLKVIARIEEAALQGALYAFAMPRGSGKTTICRLASLWALSYAHRVYAFIIGANHEKAMDSVDSVQTCIRYLPEYVADFPEISFPAVKLGGIANRARGQLCMGRSTAIEWSKERLILPTVPPPANWPDHWPLRRSDGMVPTSGLVLSASGLTADGIRGSVLTLTTGDVIRPDFVLLDDPQTAESAYSASQCTTRERLVSADVLGMAGPDRAISAVMPCTVICPGDLADNMLDRAKHPLWRGERTRMLEAMPADLGAWDAYFDLYHQDALREPPDFSASAGYYLAHQTNLEAGAVASWPARKLPGEVSAIQHAMHLYCRDRQAFYAEYQNDPEKAGYLAELPQLVASELATRLSNQPRRIAPGRATTLTAFVDCGQDLLFWKVCAWTDGFGGEVIDYGTFPEQKGRSYFLASEARPTLAQAVGVASVEASLWAGLTRLVGDLVTRRFVQAGAGAALPLTRLFIDSGWQSDVVYRFCLQSAHAALVMPSKGIGIKASAAPMNEWRRAPGERHGEGAPWVVRAAAPGRPRLVVFDANWFKSFVAARLLQPLGERGALTLFGTEEGEHRLLCDHLCAEYRVRTSGRGRQLDEWLTRPGGPDNHWLDCLVGCTVAASVEGCRLAGAGEGSRGKGQAGAEKKRETWAAVQRRKQEERRRGATRDQDA